MKPTLLVTIPVPAGQLVRLEAEFVVLQAAGKEAEGLQEEQRKNVRIVLTIGTVGFSADAMRSLPALSLICTLGAGYENIDVDFARAQGIVVSNGAGANADCVADHAMALLLGVVRRIPYLDRVARQGVWRDELPVEPGLSGKRLGLLGLGHIGQKIALRGQAFNLAIGYHSRRRRTDVAHRYFANVLALAEWSDIVVLATPGGAETRHAIDAAVLRALGPKGYLVNVARGSVVDTAALSAALANGEIAGAALDVYESEPHPPQSLTGCENLVLTPHVAGRSPEAVEASFDLFIDNAKRHLAGQAVSTPV